MNKDWLYEKIEFLKRNKKVDNLSLRIYSENQNLSRFAENHIIQNVTKKTNHIFITAFKGKSTGISKTEDISDESLKRNLRRAEKIAIDSPDDPEFVEPLEPVEIKDVDRYFENTRDLTPMKKAIEINEVKKEAIKNGMEIAGQYLNGEYRVGFVNSKGHIAFHSYTLANFSVTAMLEDSSGYSSSTDEDINKIDSRDISEVAFNKAIIGKNPVELKAGEYKVIFEPQAIVDFVPFLKWTMDRRAADEGYVYYSNRMGEKISSDNINFYSNPYNNENPSQPFVSENGLPLGKIYWIENGVLKNLQTSRYWAKKKNIKPIGNPSNFVFEGGNKSKDEIIKSTDDALLITRLWYIRFVNRMDINLTGMTRDGLYRIKNGKIVNACKNMRFNDSPIRLLNSVIELSRQERIEGYCLVPAFYVRAFRLSSATLF
jgi:predicted Zn-dependent protease